MGQRLHGELAELRIKKKVPVFQSSAGLSQHYSVGFRV